MYVQVFCHALLVFYHIERAQDKLQAAGSYLLWERHYKMVKTLVRPMPQASAFDCFARSFPSQVGRKKALRHGSEHSYGLAHTRDPANYQMKPYTPGTVTPFIPHVIIFILSFRQTKLLIAIRDSYSLMEVLTLQEASCGWITTTGLASVTGLFLTKRVTSCAAIIFPWVGVLPLQVQPLLTLYSNLTGLKLSH